MNQSGSKGMRIAVRIAVTQMAIGVAAALISFGLAGPQAAKAAMVGACIAVLPGFYFALRVFSARPGTAPQTMVKALYTGEVGKLVLTAALFMLAVLWFKTQMLPVILTYVACLAVNWLTLARQV
ncbi:MAG: ATP synthase subunit I [Salinisphaeraceae bacterium]|nr:ATP synthase subunit I [Salinisphaeraceae bacterium]